MSPFRNVAILGALIFGAAGCGGGASAAQAGGDLAGDWRSTAVEQIAPPVAPQVAAEKVRVLFLSGGRFVASARCNSISGPFEVSGGRFVAGEAAATELKCQDAEHKEDLWLAAFLTGRPTISKTVDRLELRSDTTGIVLAPRAVVSPDRPLEGTRWTLTKATAETSLLFLDGTVRGTSGCAEFVGPARIDAGAVTFGALEVDRSACKAKARTDVGSLEAVLAGPVTVRIVENSLLLLSPSKRGLTFEASSETMTK